MSKVETPWMLGELQDNEKFKCMSCGYYGHSYADKLLPSLKEGDTLIGRAVSVLIEQNVIKKCRCPVCYNEAEYDPTL